MNTNISLDQQINKLGFWSTIVAIATTIIAMLLPLDAPGGYHAEHADRVAWLSANGGEFIAGWVNQIVAMLSLSSLFFCIAWRVVANNPLRAILAAMVVLLSVVAFIIPKFIAVWTIPVLAKTITSGAMGAEMANSLLPLLNVSVPFSLYTSFDYLGFWLYSVFALMVAVPLYGQATSSKVSAVSLGLFGIIYHLMMLALLMGEVAPEEIEVYFLSPTLLLFVVIIAMMINFKKAMSQPSAVDTGVAKAI